MKVTILRSIGTTDLKRLNIAGSFNEGETKTVDVATGRKLIDARLATEAEEKTI